MRTHRSAAIATITITTIIPPLALGQGSFTWTGGAGTAVWDNALNWSFTGTSALGFPTLADDALFPIAAAVLNGNAANLTIDSGVTLTLGSGGNSSTAIGASITNEGLITFVLDNSDNFGANVDRRLLFQPGSVLITGSGAITFNGRETGLQGFGSDQSTVTNASGHTIEGPGTVFNLSLVNEGVLRTTAETLTLVNVATDNSGGLVSVADATILQLDGTTSIEGGTISGAGGQIDSDSNAVLTDLSVIGSLTIGNGSTSSIVVRGTIDNDATISMHPDTTDQFGGNNVDQRLLIEAAPATLDGIGSLTFNGFETGIQGLGRAVSTLTNGPLHTIDGQGILFNLSVINEGTITTDSTMRLVNSAIDNTTGLIDLSGTLAIENASIINGGTIRGAEGATLDSDSFDATLDGVSFEGVCTLGGGSIASLQLRGAVTNNAQLTFARDTTDQFGGNVDQRLLVGDGETATIAGSGRVSFNGPETGLQGFSRETSMLVNGQQHTIGGEGRIQNLTVANRGTLRVENGRLQLLNATLSGGTIVGNDTGFVVCNPGLLENITINGLVQLGEGGSHITDIAGGITNRGTIQMPLDTVDNFGGNVDQRLRVPSGRTTLTGRGTLALNGVETGLQGSGLDSRLVNQSIHTITGSGSVQSMTLENRGTARIDEGPFNVIEAVIDNTDGTIELGELAVLRFFGAAVIEAGTINGADGAIISGADTNDVLDGVRLTGSHTLGEGGTSTIALEGTIVNESALRFSRDTFDNFGGINVDQRIMTNPQAPATLSGTGTLTLDGRETGLQGFGPEESTITNDTAHTITGEGTIQSITLANNGTLRPTALIAAFNSSITGSGTTTIAPGAEFEFNGSLCRQGTITREDATSTFDFNGERLEFNTFNGDLTHDSGTFSPHAGGPGSAAINGEFMQTASVSTGYEIGGLLPGEFDLVSITGAATIAGTLSLAFTDGFQPQIGDSWIVLESDVSVTGTYTGLPEGAAIEPAVNGVQLFVSYAVRDGRTVALLARDQRCSLADLAEPLGVIDIFDLLAYFNIFSAGDALADLNLDGVSNVFDILLYFQQFGSGC